jgi:hypothetical protein
MKAPHQGLIVLLSSVTFATGAVQAAPITGYSDQWWVPTESGWGAAVLQQSNTLFVDLMVYGADSKPTWYTAAAVHDSNSATGHEVFAGDLYATTGPYFGGAFDPALVGRRKVGTLAFDATAADKAAISYTVDGIPAVKNVSRQTWSYENLSGTYETVWKTGCGPEAEYVFDWTTTRTSISHNADNSVTMTVTCPLCFDQFQYDLRGTYSQSGHLGQIAADLVAPAGGTIVISEIARSTAGFTGRFTGNITKSGRSCRVESGLIGAALR